MLVSRKDTELNHPPGGVPLLSLKRLVQDYGWIIHFDQPEDVAGMVRSKAKNQQVMKTQATPNLSFKTDQPLRASWSSLIPSGPARLISNCGVTQTGDTTWIAFQMEVGPFGEHDGDLI